jgi:hypothetical protein
VRKWNVQQYAAYPVARAPRMARGRAMAPPRLNVECHCWTARRAGACLATGMQIRERAVLDPGGHINVRIVVFFFIRFFLF